MSILPAQLTCRVLHVAESGCYAWRNRPPSNRLVKHAWLIEAIVGIHTASHGTYGSRRVHAEFGLGLRIHVSHGTVELLMQRASLHGLPGNRHSRAQHVTPSVADLVERKSPVTPGTSYGSPTSPTSPTSPSTPLLRARCTARSPWTRSRDAWWAGRSTPHPPRR
ncbi:IS3 family transposase [Streptomyces sp. NPDC048419]|uniref:IS3 family transposase n=1 Tax=Streptomyces sp. NPDC048419 TaxID=3365547 RepID=UPI00371CF396